jgi:phage-related baseplate assembly protein
MADAPSIIDLSALPAPEAIEELDFETLLQAFKDRFATEWAAARAIDPSLPDYDVSDLETDPVVILGQAWSFLRLLDRERVNDAYRALLAPFAAGTNLQAIAATRDITRLTAIPANGDVPAVLESDEALLKRFLYSYDRAAAGSANQLLYEAYTAWPQAADKSMGLWDARVNGWAVHGRRGDTDVVIIGPNGDTPSEGNQELVRQAVTHPSVKPEAVFIEVVPATRIEYEIDLHLEIPASGPAPDLVLANARDRVQAAATSRILIGGEIPPDYLPGAAYSENVLKVTDNAPVTIEADPYSVPVMTSLTMTIEVRS